MSAAIWVDADACPRAIREILFRAAERTGVHLTLVAVRREIPLILVANHLLPVPKSPWITSRQVEQGFDVADDAIARQVSRGDLVITSDIPLAAEVIEKGAVVISPRGERLTPENVRQKLNMRDFMETMRSSGVVTGGPPALGDREKQAFANALDRYLAQQR